MSAAGALRERLQSLEGCGDADSLRSAVGELCAEFGKVTRIDILTMAEADKRQALCFLRLESEAQEMRLMASLGASRFGEDVLVVVDVPFGPGRVAWGRVAWLSRGSERRARRRRACP